MKIIIHWALSALAVLVAASILPGITIRGFWVALIVAVVLGVLNAFVKPVLFVLTLPINLLTFGIFTFVLNTLMVLLTARLIDGFSVLSFVHAFIFSIVLSAVSWVIHHVAKAEHLES